MVLNTLQHSTSQKCWEPYICRGNQTNRLEKLIVEFPHTALHLKWVQTNRSDKLGYLKKKWAVQTSEKSICIHDILITYTFIKQNTWVDLMLQWSWRDLSICFKFCKCLKVLQARMQVLKVLGLRVYLSILLNQIHGVTETQSELRGFSRDEG